MAAAHDYDLVVVGAGPAGGAAAARAAQRGQRVLVLESERFPRFHIGESLLPLGHRVFEQLGIATRLDGAGFVVKRGAQLRTPDGEHTVLFDFQQARHVDPAWTFQVHRAEFDQLLLEHAVAAGAELRAARARDYRVDAGGVEIGFEGPGGAPGRVRARALVDASGRAGFVARREGVRRPDDELRKAAVFAHFRGVPVDPGDRAGDTRIVSLPRLGWFWFIPLKGGVMSVGAVLDLAVYQERPKGDPAAIFAEAVGQAPYAARLLAGAERVSDFVVESGFSYGATRYGGDRWLLAGDAGSFLDPVFSTGVLLALRSGVEAADAAEAAWVRPRRRPDAVVARFDRMLQARYRFVRRFVTGFYDPATRDMFFAPRPTFGITRAVTTVLAGGFDLGWLDRQRVRLFFLLGWLQRRFDLVPRRLHARGPAAGSAGATVPVVET